MKIIEKPWGSEHWWADEPGKYLGKILVVRGKEKLSVQYHEEKTETMMLLTGTAKLYTHNEDGSIVMTQFMQPRESFTLHPGWIHSVEAMTDCEILEVSTYHPEDVVRIQDQYGRVPVQ